MKALNIMGALIILSGCVNNDKKIDGYGNFEAEETLISAQAQGEILSFKVEEGTGLKAGEIVGFIDTTQLSLKEEQLLAQMKGSETKISNVTSQIDVQQEQKRNLLIEKNRIDRLLKDSAATPQQYDDISGKLRITESNIASIKTQNAGILNEIEAIRKQIDQVKDQIKKSYIVNPMAGIVLEKYAEPHEIASPGKVLYKIADLSYLKLKVYISGNQLSMIKLGQKVKVNIDNESKEKDTLEGEICWIASQSEFTPKIIQTKEERVNLVYAVKIRVKNDGRLKIGMPGEVEFQSVK